MSGYLVESIVVRTPYFQYMPRAPEGPKAENPAQCQEISFKYDLAVRRAKAWLSPLRVL